MEAASASSEQMLRSECFKLAENASLVVARDAVCSCKRHSVEWRGANALLNFAPRVAELCQRVSFKGCPGDANREAT